ncbi:MAG: HAD family hydrolase [Desulfobacteraceae bacterium]|jgi:FMN phosphatase YigB (HAD superfamily)|nr:MAG: HAD family hydrolase [Desulfobacteraceae bacterium]
MYNTLLFDLDGTLLDIDMDIFLPRYFQVLTRRFSYLISPEEFVRHLLHSTRLMIMNKDPQKTNEEVFMEDFIPRLGLPREELQPILTDIYTNDFGHLGKYTRRKPLARTIMNLSYKKGLELIIATNPVFPRLAIEHRLRWSGLEDLPYRLVTTYENMHFCKPHREYYEEVLSVAGRKPGECLMIGNDAREDLAAAAVGIKTFLVRDHILNDNKEGPFTPDYEGYLADVYRFIEQWPQNLDRDRDRLCR